MNETIGLLPCPFCGHSATEGGNERLKFVRCDGCGIGYKKFRDEIHDPVELWNRRAILVDKPAPDTPQDGDDSGNPAMLALAIADAFQEAGHEQAMEMIRDIDAKMRALLDELERVKGERWQLAQMLWTIPPMFSDKSPPALNLAASILIDEPAPVGDDDAS